MSQINAETFLKGMAGRFDPSKAQGVDAEVQLNLSGEGGGNYYIVIRDGKAGLAQGASTKPTATVDVSAADWIGIGTGKLDPMMAFMTGKIKVSGDIGFMMKFQSMFQ
jgi:putative sterol carrier protein